MHKPYTRASAFMASAHTFVCAAYPVWVVAGSNAGVLPTSIWVLLRASVATIALTLVLLWVLRFVIRDLAARAMFLSVLFLLWSMFWLVAAAVQAVSMPVQGSAAFATTYTVAAIAGAAAVVRPWRDRPRNLVVMNVLAGVLLGANVYPFVSSAKEDNSGWQARADRLVEAALARQSPVSAPERDVVYLVLDGFGRGDVLREKYGVDLAPFTAFLRSRGFVVPERGQSNYAQTYLSLASAMNLTYLDALATPADRASQDRRPLARLIQQNALMKLARRAGYRVAAIGSDYSATESFGDVDVCICERHGLDDLERSAMALTPFASLPIDRWTFDAHRRKLLESFDALIQPLPANGRTFTFAHVLAPHPPFVFDADGRPRRSAAPINLFDGDHFVGSRDEYLGGYAQQARFTIRQLTHIVDVILSRPGPPPAIVIHGDHGPGSGLRWEDPSRTDMRERLAIFSAYYFPGVADADIAASTTPVNGARALARHYFGADAPPLDDRSYFSTWSRPYEFIPVPPSPVWHPSDRLAGLPAPDGGLQSAPRAN